MAATGRILASIYAIGGNATTGTQGVMNSFPSSQVLFYQAPISTTVGAVTINSIIVLLPSGLNQPQKFFSTDSTVAQLGTNGS